MHPESQKYICSVNKRQNKKQKWFVINKILSGNHMIDKNPNEKIKEEKKLKQEVQN